MVSCEQAEYLGFFETYKDVINIFIGIISGILLSTITFLLTYRNNWRNCLTKEFTVNLRLDQKRVSKNGITSLKLKYEINNTSGNELSINSAYIKIPKNVKGNPGPNSTLGEIMFEKGRHYVFDDKKIITHTLSDEITINHNQILSELAKKGSFKLRLFVNTSKYGTVKSNFCKIKNHT